VKRCAKMLEYKKDDDDQAYPLCWDASYEIVLALMRHYPDVNIDEVGLEQLKALIVSLPNFADDPALANDALLSSILREWYEESNADLFDNLR
jgi:FeS assembly protein IscX